MVGVHGVDFEAVDSACTSMRGDALRADVLPWL